MNDFPRNIICETSKADDGNMDFRFGGRHEVIENRKKFLEKFGIAYQEHIAMSCDHGETISFVDEKTAGMGAASQESQIKSEVLITQKKHIALMLFTADCQPVSFFDPVTGTIALAHISRKTLTQKLSSKTIQYLKTKLDVNPSDLQVHIGPSIQKESYSFDIPLFEEHPLLVPYTEIRHDKAYIDLIGAHLNELDSLHIKKENISISPDDTASLEYFSYYMMKKT